MGFGVYGGTPLLAVSAVAGLCGFNLVGVVGGVCTHAGMGLCHYWYAGKLEIWVCLFGISLGDLPIVLIATGVVERDID
jgi:hypothetical protein